MTIILLAAGVIFIYTKQYLKVSLPKNNFDTTATVPNTNISFKYPSEGFYGLGVKFLDSAVEPGADMTKIKQIGFEYSAPKDPTKVSEYINFYIGLVTEKGNVDGDYTLENAVKSIKKIYDPSDIDDGRYETFNGHEFYLYKQDDDRNSRIWLAYFLQNDGVYRLTIQYLKPNNILYGKQSDTPESRAAFKNNDQLFLGILKNITLE